jgi:hypothetical protein
MSTTVPAVTSRSFAVASSLLLLQSEMSPAPTITSPGGGGALTVINALPDLPPAVAVIVAVPAATPVTSPDCVTVATELFELAHVNDGACVGFDVAVS